MGFGEGFGAEGSMRRDSGRAAVLSRALRQEDLVVRQERW